MNKLVIPIESIFYETYTIIFENKAEHVHTLPIHGAHMPLEIIKPYRHFVQAPVFKLHSRQYVPQEVHYIPILMKNYH